MERIVLAYSGSLADSAAIPLLADEHHAEVVTLTLDLGQNHELEEVRDRALSAGAVRAHVLDARDEFARAFVLPALQAGALDDGREPMAFQLAHALIGKKLVEMASIEEAATVAHRRADRTCIENSIRALNARLRVLGLSTPSAGLKTRTNLWARAIDHDVSARPAEALYLWTKSPDAAPETGAGLELSFERGVPTAINGVSLDLSELIESLSIIAGRHGVGRRPSADNQTMPARCHQMYETPAAVVLHAAHDALEEATGVHDRSLKQQIRRTYAELILRGAWFSPLREAIDVLNSVVQAQVNGTVRLQLLKGNYTVMDVRVAGLGAESSTPVPDSPIAVPQS